MGEKKVTILPKAEKQIPFLFDLLLLGGKMYTFSMLSKYAFSWEGQALKENNNNSPL